MNQLGGCFEGIGSLQKVHIKTEAAIKPEEHSGIKYDVRGLLKLADAAEVFFEEDG